MIAQDQRFCECGPSFPPVDGSRYSRSNPWLATWLWDFRAHLLSEPCLLCQTTALSSWTDLPWLCFASWARGTLTFQRRTNGPLELCT